MGCYDTVGNMDGGDGGVLRTSKCREDIYREYNSQNEKM